MYFLNILLKFDEKRTCAEVSLSRAHRGQKFEPQNVCLFTIERDIKTCDKNLAHSGSQSIIFNKG
ncbi:hypothetical protein T4E_2845 [Trichinella pseudospiralis]|uniref:Uncharacterized protein n=1 Tax=Trichinella pseudospiralis TaxID=6337 RepID=A0A0V0YL28_TRIPS|nr:hypothetical protein T4E_2845 [Trichinella pseudospiralis]